MKTETKIHFSMSIASVFWAGAFIAGKIGVQEFSAYGITFFRFLFATILIFGALLMKEGKNWRLERHLWPKVILLGVVGMFGYHILFFTSLKYTTAINSSLIGATNPLLTTILAAIFLKEYLSMKRIGAILLALCGVVLTVTNGDLNVLLNFSLNYGDIIMLLAVICWAVYSIMSKKVMSQVTPLKLTAYIFLVCLVMLIPFMIWEKIWMQLPEITFKGWAAVLYMAVFPSVLGYLIQLTSIQQIGASRTAVYINLVPVFSMALSYLVLNELISGLKILTAGMIIMGVYLNSRFK
ncbi:MAG: DMT family transporter [Halanaerobiales bacterium]|nr:DMT family transporter [Halanaerobiales bacterium]